MASQALDAMIDATTFDVNDAYIAGHGEGLVDFVIHVKPEDPGYKVTEGSNYNVSIVPREDMVSNMAKQGCHDTAKILQDGPQSDEAMVVVYEPEPRDFTVVVKGATGR